ncbi:hypothetical protein [Microbispora sp. NPDC046933]|uniref:hypothetical protein n=1 Tax=Microbispora sp. NPDC046933 TaxID=3155618 RepID=UPI0033F62A55
MVCHTALTRVAGLTAAAVLAIAVSAVPWSPAAATTAPISHGWGAGGEQGGDINANRSSINVGQGRNVRNYLAFGSLKNGAGLQQATISVSGASNSQGNFCKRRPRLCNARQKAWIHRPTTNIGW